MGSPGGAAGPLKAGPGTTLTYSYELKGPMDIVVVSSDGKTETSQFEEIDDVLAALLAGKVARNYWQEPDVIPGPSSLKAKLVEKGVTLEMTVARSDLPPGPVTVGQGFLNEDEVGRELPFVVTRIEGDKVTLSKVACAFRYHIHEVVSTTGSFSIVAGGVGDSSARGEKRPMANEIAPVPSIGTTQKPARLGDGLVARLGALLTKALEDVTSLEVRTFTSDTNDTALASSGDPLIANTRLRAFTRIAIDGDTQICVPLRASGEPDEALWKLHSEAVAGARDDRAKTIASAIALVKELAGK